MLISLNKYKKCAQYSTLRFFWKFWLQYNCFETIMLAFKLQHSYGQRETLLKQGTFTRVCGEERRWVNGNGCENIEWDYNLMATRQRCAQTSSTYASIGRGVWNHCLLTIKTATTHPFATLRVFNEYPEGLRKKWSQTEVDWSQ